MRADRRLKILYEDNHLLVVNKPAGLATIGVSETEPSLAKLAKAYLKHKHDKPGNVYLGVMSRLDAAVSGAVVLARTSKAAARLTAQFAGRDVTKIYWALVAGRVEPPSGSCLDWIGKDESRARVVVLRANHPDAREARLSYRRLLDLRAVPRFSQASLVEIELLTGRKHQIRVQLAVRGWPILGDRKYGSRERWPAGIALHARRLAFEHPVRREPIEIVAGLPAAWPELEGLAERTGL